MSRAPAIVVSMLTALVAACSTGGSMGSLSQTDRAFLQASATWDIDKDGVVTCEEWRSYAAALFKEADANADGMLTRAEYADMARIDRLFELVGFGHFDQNGDGRVSTAELVDKPNPAFAILDKNGDCRLTADEMPTLAGQPPGQRDDDPRGAEGRRRR